MEPLWLLGRGPELPAAGGACSRYILVLCLLLGRGFPGKPMCGEGTSLGAGMS